MLPLWWLVVTIGVAGIVGGLSHLFDGARIVKDILFPLVAIALYALRERAGRIVPGPSQARR